MVRLTAALISALNDGADCATIQSLSIPNRDFDQVVELDVCENLTRLDISGNRLPSLQSISMCTSLKWLSIAGNCLSSLKGVELLSNLTVLNASKNSLSSILEVAGLVNLRALILNNNNITSLCRLDALTNLNTLVLSHNPICKLGKSVAKLVSLTKLSVSHCQIQLLGPCLRRCVALEELRLAHNKLSELPEELANNGHLCILDLGSNNLSTWNSLQVVKSLPALTNLNLHGNPICSVSEYEKEVKSLIPSLQIFDGRPLQPFHKKRPIVKKAKSLKLSNDSGTDNKEEKPAKKKKSQKLVEEKEDVEETKGAIPIMAHNQEDSDMPDKPFIDLIPAAGDKNLAGTALQSQDSGVVSIINGDGKSSGRTKQHIGSTAVLDSLRQVEIGLGGPSTWDTPPPPIVPDKRKSATASSCTRQQAKKHGHC